MRFVGLIATGLFVNVLLASSPSLFFSCRGIIEHSEVSRIQWSWEIGKVVKDNKKTLCLDISRCTHHTFESFVKMFFPCISALLLAGYALCMYGFYSMMPVVVKMSSATAVNLSLLTGDLFSLFCGLFLFHYSVSI